jgi:hypothetical protein
MENQIINGIELGSYEAIALSLGQAKKENRDGKKARFAVFTYQSTYSGRAKPVRDIIFEEDMGSDTFEKLKEYIKKDAENNNMKDSRGGYIVDIDKILDAADANSRAEKRIKRLFLDVPGGMVVPYKLQGERYANDINGQPVLNKQNQKVTKTTIRVFVQVERIIPGDDGKPQTIYVGGISPEVKGQEMQDRFYRVPVANTSAAAPSEPAESEDESAF